MSKLNKCTKCHGLGYYDEGHENDDGSMSGGNYVNCELCNKNADAERYKRMFEAACVDLGTINAHLGLDQNAGGAGPIIAAIKELKELAEQGQKLAISVMSNNGNMFVG